MIAKYEQQIYEKKHSLFPFFLITYIVRNFQNVPFQKVRTFKRSNESHTFVYKAKRTPGAYSNDSILFTVYVLFLIDPSSKKRR